MKKRRIVLASLLKPLNDPRMFEKMAVSLARTGRYEVHLIGYPSSAQPREPSVHFHALPKFRRLSLGRMRARVQVLRFLIELKPELFVVTTHELLGVAILIRILFGAKIVYDIQENYWRNIIYTDAFPKATRTVIACLVRVKEVLTSKLIHHFILAEKGYLNELAWVKNKCTVVENKCRLPDGFLRKPTPGIIQLIFTGTIAESTGVFQAINLATELHRVEPRIRLHIVGYCPLDTLYQKINGEIDKNDFMTLTGGNEFVSHGSILNVLSTANFGIISYPLSPHIENKIPTKLYEYLACQVPLLLQDHQPWTALCAPYHAAIVLDFERPDIGSILAQIHANNFYSSNPEGMTWPSEEGKWVNIVNHIF